MTTHRLCNNKVWGILDSNWTVSFHSQYWTTREMGRCHDLSNHDDWIRVLRGALEPDVWSTHQPCNLKDLKDWLVASWYQIPPVEVLQAGRSEMFQQGPPQLFAKIYWGNSCILNQCPVTTVFPSVASQILSRRKTYFLFWEALQLFSHCEFGSPRCLVKSDKVKTR